MSAIYNLHSSSIFDKDKIQDPDQNLTISLQVKIRTLENILPVYLEELETEENKSELDKLQQSYWLSYELRKFSFFLFKFSNFLDYFLVGV
jgi:hypothetical protein